MGRPSYESLEVLAEVCLVEVAEVERQFRPVGGATAPYFLDGLVQPVALNDPLRAHPNVTTEKPLERPFRHINDRNEVIDFAHVRIGSYLIDYLADHHNVLITDGTPSPEQFLGQFDVSFVIGAGGDGLFERLRGGTEDVRQMRHTVCKFGQRRAEKWVEAARPELDAEDPSGAFEHASEPAFDDANDLGSSTLHSDVDRGVRKRFLTMVCSAAQIPLDDPVVLDEETEFV